ncbi:hypothetical protein NKG94_07675 [Micromonospora sp. M12]
MTSSLDTLPKIGAPATRALHGAGYTALRQLADVPGRTWPNCTAWDRRRSASSRPPSKSTGSASAETCSGGTREPCPGGTREPCPAAPASHVPAPREQCGEQAGRDARPEQLVAGPFTRPRG